ncbi:MAG: helix-hairpin-helix domain-containing protein [Mucinivorans sp.]
MRAESVILTLLALVVVCRSAASFVGVDGGDAPRWIALTSRADSVLAPRVPINPPPDQRHDYKSIFARKPYVVELNGADSVALCRVYGIGPVFAHRIIARRAALGGFHSLAQLLEIRGIDGSVLDVIGKSFLIDSSRIQKININFAPSNVLVSHPYFTPSMVRRIEKERKKGGIFSSTRDLITKDILLPGEALRVAPYLLWSEVQGDELTQGASGN